jgi:hypothetical protein
MPGRHHGEHSSGIARRDGKTATAIFLEPVAGHLWQQFLGEHGHCGDDRTPWFFRSEPVEKTGDLLHTDEEALCFLEQV